MISPRAVATLGIGFGARSTAMLGLVAALVILPAEPAPRTPAASGGLGDESGVGYLRTEHGWVRLTKIARAGARTFSAHVQVGAGALGTVGSVEAVATALTPGVQSRLDASVGTAEAKAADLEAGSSNIENVDISRLVASAQKCHVNWLDGDELVIILEELT